MAIFEAPLTHGPGPCVVRRSPGRVHRRLASDLLLRRTALFGPPEAEAAIGGAQALAWPEHETTPIDTMRFRATAYSMRAGTSNYCLPRPHDPEPRSCWVF